MASNFQHNQLITEAAESSSNESNNNMDLDSDNKSSDDELELIQFCSFYPQILNPEPSHYNHPKSDDWVRNVLFNYDETRFRRTLRMNKTTFFALVNQIKKHSIFYSNSNNLQTNVEIQLAMTLFRLGAPSTIWNVSMLFGIAKEMQGFPLVIGAIDSSPSVHDTKIFQNSSIYNQQNILLKEKEYLLGNSAYPLLPFIITPFKVPDGLQQQQINYNIKYKIRIRDPPKGIEIIDTVLILHNFIEKHDTWGQSNYNDNQIEIQPEEDEKLIDQI
ncbi:13702_t:CDS:2 [Gigaspora rosea]|nr:13702_t:CDS:2 [Gigaspora rosea]